MRKATLVAACLSVFTSAVAVAEELLVQVFLNDAPLTGVGVRVEGSDKGETDDSGSVSTNVRPGEREVMLVDGAEAYPVAVSVNEDVITRLTVVFNSVEGVAPLVEVDSYTKDEAPNGFITGVVANESGVPLSGARVVSGGVVAVTDAEGVFQLSVTAGTYDVRVSANGYRTAVAPGVRVVSGVGVATEVQLSEVPAEQFVEATQPDLILEEVVVMGTFRVEESAEDVKRYATNIVNAIDVEMLERFGDSDVAAAMRRVAGVSVQDNKYATVRGLDGRYISSTLNGLVLPSTDPQRRDVQLDLFPTNILGGIEITKAFTPDQLASTTGGGIQISTKGLPTESVFKVSAGTGFTSGVTGEDGLFHRGSDTDALGYDNGLRELLDFVLDVTNEGRQLTVCDPGIDENLCTDRVIAAGAAVAMEDDYNVKNQEILPQGSFGISYGDRLDLDSGAEWGYYLAGNYSYGNSDRGNAVLSNPLGDDGGYNRTNETVDVSLYGVIGVEWGVADELVSKTTVLRSTDIQTRQDDFFDNNEDIDRFATILQFVERQLVAQSISGYHEFALSELEGTQLSWNLGVAQTQRNEPDRRQYQYFNDALSFSAFERRWSELTEDTIDVSVDYTIPVDWGMDATTEFTVGLLSSTKDRDVELYRFSLARGSKLNDLQLTRDLDLESDILSYANFALDAFRLAPSTTSTDTYISDEETTAYYVSAKTEFGEAFTFLVGGRQEKFIQDLRYPNSADATSELTVDEFYPAVNFSWRPSDSWQLRLAYSETVSYPGLIERSESLSFDPLTDDPIFGNPNLVASTIDNIDARLEYYFSDYGSLSLAVFQKEIDSPIERALPDASGSATSGITFRNQESAELSGAEIEGAFNIIDNDSMLVFVNGNASYIDSEVVLGPDSLRLEGAAANGRALQGQSEYLANLQIGVDHYASEQRFTLLLNYFDDRIFRIARGAALGPEVRSGRYLLDATYDKQFSDALSLQLIVRNILDDEIEWTQNSNVIESFQTGTSFSLKLNYEFL